MIDTLDKQTHPLPLDEPKRRRGRQATGNAMTPAERQKAYRERLKSQRNVTESESTHDTKSLQLLRERALSRGKTCVAQARMIGALENRIADLEKQLAQRNEKPPKAKRHRNDNALEKIKDLIERHLAAAEKGKLHEAHARAIGAIMATLEHNGFKVQE